MNDDEILQEFGSLWRVILEPNNKIKLIEEFPRVEKLSSMEIKIIEIVYSKEDVIFKEICSILDIPKSTLTSAIDRLERLNYVTRVISKRDRRSYGLILTDEGYEVQSEYLAFEKKLSGYILSGLDTDEEREMLLELLRKIANNI
ncbi:MAG: helix-turn-helix domain-containing protein [Clostridium sp.]|nr:helix-turn-helix domain-containing protein [Clostridium sp.]